MIPAPFLVCPECGAPLDDRKFVGTVCEECLNRRYHVILLQREAEAWAENKFDDVELSREKGRVQHPVLKFDRGVTYCCVKATESRPRRMRVKLNHFPEGLCPKCLTNYERVQRRAAELRQAKGAPNA
jgi:hypothetical protein